MVAPAPQPAPVKPSTELPVVPVRPALPPALPEPLPQPSQPKPTPTPTFFQRHPKLKNALIGAALFFSGGTAAAVIATVVIPIIEVAAVKGAIFGAVGACAALIGLGAATGATATTATKTFTSVTKVNELENVAADRQGVNMLRALGREQPVADTVLAQKPALKLASPARERKVAFGLSAAQTRITSVVSDAVIFSTPPSSPAQ